jgi:hypothetical protein
MTWLNPLYGDVTVEVADNTAGTVTWVDVSNELLNVTASRGGDAAAVGESDASVGMLTAMFHDFSTTVNVGFWIRVRVTGNTIWAGSVTDRNSVTVFDDNTPGLTYEVTTLTAADWVQVVGNVTANGSVVYPMTGLYNVTMSVGAAVDSLNNAVSTGYDIISYNTDFNALTIGQTDLSGTVAEHLDVICNSDSTDEFNWRPTLLSPTTSHAPAGAIYFDTAVGDLTSIVFTDDVTGLHYTDLTVQELSSDVLNVLTVNNRAMIRASNNPKLRVFTDESATAVDAGSIGIYGEHSAEFDARIPMEFNYHNLKRDINLCWNPNAEYGTEGYLVDSSATTNIRRFKPSSEATPFDAYDGDYALRRTFLAAGPNTNIMYNHDGGEGIPVIAGYGYKFLVRGARYTTATDAQVRAEISWYDDNGALISTIIGTPVTLTNIRQWYAASHSGTAPATAVTAKIRATFLRSGGTNFAIGAKLYADAFTFQEVTSLTDTITYFSGDTEDTTGFIHSWFGQEGRSESGRFINYVQNKADITVGGDTAPRVRELRWNATEDFTAAAQLDLLHLVTVRNANVNGGAPASCLITGIDWEITPDSIMCTLKLR